MQLTQKSVLLSNSHREYSVATRQMDCMKTVEEDSGDERRSEGDHSLNLSHRSDGGKTAISNLGNYRTI
jgi:hypothetical protein